MARIASIYARELSVIKQGDALRAGRVADDDVARAIGRKDGVDFSGGS
jgi:hypothetical protein